MLFEMISRSIHIIVLSCLSIILSACSTTILVKRGPYLRAYHEGSFYEAEAKIDALASQECSNNQYTSSKDASWILLDRATIHFALGDIDAAIYNYKCALESLDFYNKNLPVEQLTQVLLQDEVGAYQADDFEQVLARVYFALALLHNGDENNACALLRQAEEYQQDKRQFYAKVPFTKEYQVAENGLCKFLFANLLERKGDLANAKILYRQANELSPYISNMEMDCKKTSSESATVLILCHNGNAPYKISATSTASVASAIALECILAVNQIDPAWSTLSGIPVPVLQYWPFSSPLPTFANVKGRQIPLYPLFSIDQAARYELQQKMPVLAARGVARLLARRCTVGYFQNQSPGLGVLADVSMMLINENTRADTRSWTTLPSRIDAAKLKLSPGRNTLDIQISDPFYPESLSYDLNLRSNDLCIIHVFNIHPGIRRILIPNQFLITSKEL